MFKISLKTSFLIISIIFIVIFSLLHMNLYESKKENLYDAGENLVGAHTIAKFNTFSLNWDPHPSAKREPIYPFFLGMIIKAKSIFIQDADDIVLQDIEEVNTLKIFNMIILFLTIYLVGAFVIIHTKNLFLSAYAIASLVFSASLAESAHTFLSEVISSFFILTTSILLYLYGRYSNKIWYYFLLGLIVSSLVLTKAFYLYFIPIIIFYMIFIKFDEIRLNKLSRM